MDGVVAITTKFDRNDWIPVNHETPPTANVSERDRATASRWGDRVPGPWAMAIIGVCLLAMVGMYPIGLRWDRSRADLNVALLVLALILGITLVVWFLFRSRYSVRLRVGVAIFLLVSGGLLPALFRIDRVSGDLVPRLAFRWQPARDRVLGSHGDVFSVADLRTTTAEDSPEFLGPQRRNRWPERLLATDWEEHPPRKLWEMPIGAGWSGFSVVNGYAVTMEQRGDDELVTCLDVATGEVQWYHAVRTRHETVLGGVGPRGTPTIHEGRVYALGATGILRCLDGETGEEIWSDNIQERLGLDPQSDRIGLPWGRSASPLIVGELVVVPWGGPGPGPYVSLAAYDRENGQVAWTGGEHQASYASPVLAALADRLQILSVNQNYLTSHCPESGALLWQHPWPGMSASNVNASNPMPLAQDRVLLSKGYGGGAQVIQVTCKGGDDWRVEPIWANHRVLQTKYTNVVIRGDFAYGLSDGILECVRLRDGRRQWKGGRYGQGQLLGVGDALLVQAESGDVALVAAIPDRHQELGRFSALSGITWNQPSLYGNRLLVRNAERAACYELALRDDGA